MDITIRLAVWYYMVTQGILNCPLLFDDWNKASAALQCREPNYYHCLRDDNGKFQQHCLQRVWIQDGMCPEYNSRANRIDVYNCISQLNDCPTAISDAGCFCNATSLPYQTTMMSSSYSVITYKENSGEKDSDNTTIIVIVVCASLLIILIIFMLFALVFWLRRRSRQNREPERTVDVKVRRDIKEEIENKNLIGMERIYSTSEDECTKNKRLTLEKDETDGLLETYGNKHKMETENKINNTDEQVQVIGNNELVACTDTDKLENNGVIIFISDDTSKNDQRIKSLDATGRFGKSQYVGSLLNWDPEEDISLYLFRHSLDDINSAQDVMDLKEKLQKMHKQATKTPKSYFVLSSQTDEWRRFEKDLLKYHFFKKPVKLEI